MFRKSLNVATVCFRRFLSSKPSVALDWVKHEKVMMEPFEYIQKVPCKHVRMMATIFNPWLKAPAEKVQYVTEITDALITWNILFDDIENDTSFRYGVPAAHCIFGVSSTINAANKALLKTYNQIAEIGDPLGPRLYLKEIENYLNGHGVELYWQNQCIFPTEEAFMDIKAKKSGPFFVLPVELLKLCSKNATITSNKTDYTELGTNIGIYYYMLDDHYNLFHPKALSRFTSAKNENHSTSNDITDGKISLPVIHASQFPDVAPELTDILKQRTSDPKLLSRAISLLKKHGSDEYSKEKLRELEHHIRTEVDRLGGNPTLLTFMDDISLQTSLGKVEHELMSDTLHKQLVN